MAALYYEWAFFPNYPEAADAAPYVLQQRDDVYYLVMPAISDFPPAYQTYFEYEGHSFVEWNTKADGSGISYTPGESYVAHEVAANASLYAIWKTDASQETYVLTITTGSATKTYDGTPLQSSSISVNGLPDGSPITVQATGALNRIGSVPNTYKINWGTENPDNYTVIEHLGTLTVNPVPLTITVENATKTYGDADPEFTYTVSGLILNDQPEDLNVIISRESGEDVGSYTLVPSVSVVMFYYERVYVNGTLEITHLPVTVTANAASKLEGEDDPAFTATIDPITVPSSSLTFEFTREPGETQGEYIVTPVGEAIQGNYAVTFVPGILVIVHEATPEDLPYLSVKIPDELLRDAGTLTAYLTYSDAEAGEYRTVKIVNLEIMPRMKRPEDEEDTTPSESIYAQLKAVEDKVAGLYDQLAKIRMQL